MDLQIRFLLPVSGKLVENQQIVSYNEWYFLPIQEALQQSSEFLEEYLQTEPLNRENLVGGFEIETDGQSWNHFYFGQFRQTMEWFSGLERLFSGEKIVLISVFEDSKLILKRHDTRLTMYETWDDFYPRTDFSAEITLDFKDFTKKFFSQSQFFADFILKIHQLISIKEKTADNFMKAKLKLIQECLPPSFSEKINLLSSDILNPLYFSSSIF